MASEAKQRKIDNFFVVKTPVPTKSLVQPIIEDIISAVLKNKKSHVAVTESTIESWKKSYPWIKLTEKDNDVRLKCCICEKFSAGNVWANDGGVNIQKSAIDRHCASEEYIEAWQKDIKSSTCCSSHSEGDDDLKDLDQPDISLFRTVYSLMKNEIPINQLDAMLELQRLNGVEMPYKNLSWTTVTEIQDIIADNYKKDLITEINTSNFYALLLDESTDITVSKRLSICVRYVRNGQAVTSFLASTEIPDGCAYTIVESVHKVITSLGLDLTKCVSLATDGASVMTGKKTGVGVQLKSKFCPFLTQTHCIAHRFNLAITDAIKNNDTMKKLREMFQSLYNFMSSSTKWINTLKAMQDLLNEPEISIKEPHSIRWLGLKRSVEVVYDCFGSLLAALSNLATENSTAKGLFKYFSTYKTALLIGLMLDIHTELGILSCNMQQQSLVFSDVFPLIEGTVGKLEYMKSHEGNGLYEMRKTIDISDDSGPSYNGEPLKNYKKEKSDSEFETVKLAYIDSLTNNIKKRIRKDDSVVLSSLGLLLEPLSFTISDQNALQCITKLYYEPKVTKTRAVSIG
ncbi:zinc finger protein 862-like [Mercenaria mercenaria]|uniref:zinc finger protein 862-like n=1 Tax=Mercenaria mercenaria TaxID=6596 RepID=UPI00234EA442|nr:zinc finger protein 862-like [Mercenaria mercenaria]